MKEFRSWLKSLSTTSRIGVLLLAVSFLIGLIEFLMHLKDARDLLATFILWGLKLDPAPRTSEMANWLFVFFSVGTFLACAFFLLWLRAEFRPRNDDTVRTLRGVMRAAGHICKRMFPASHISDSTIEAVHLFYQIHRDFTAQVRREYRVRAGSTPIYFMERGFRVREYADSTESLIDIDFKVRDTVDPEGLVYLPMANEGRNKSACIFFLPRIEPGQARTFEMSYRWPRMVGALKAIGEEEFTLRHNSEGPMAEFSMEFYLEPGTGGRLSWEESGPILPNRKVSEVTSQLNWPGVRYEGSNIPRV